MSDEEMGYGTVTFEDDSGDEFELTVLDYFFYNGQEYAVLADRICGDACEEEEDACSDCEVEIYYMKVDTDGEEETFIPIEDDALLDALDAAYHSQLDEEDEEDE